jgi:UDP-N-acetylglucosamine 2-epimerase (non-hydrolysing)
MQDDIEYRSTSTEDGRLTRMDVMCVAGARPNFMKISPIVKEVEARGWNLVLVHTGQHYDEMMSDIFFRELGIPVPHHSLGVGPGSQGDQVGRIMSAFEPVLTAHNPDVLVVVGDVNSTMGCALVGAKTRTVIAHVEAGLRSTDWSMPEEVNRIVTDAVSDVLLAPSDDAVDNLVREGVPSDRIRLVGNVMVDTLLQNLGRSRDENRLSRFGLHPQDYVLVTLHRPALVDDPEKLGSVLECLREIATTRTVVWPVHPRTRARIGTAPEGVVLLEPQGYLDFIALEADASLVLTDSGGVQEETTVLGVPCLTLRKSTERPVTVLEGTNRIVGTNSDAILAAVRETLIAPPLKRRPSLWDGHAAARVADALAEFEGRKRTQ